MSSVSLTLLEPPTDQLVALQLVKNHLRVNQNYDIELIKMYLDSAVDIVETYTNRCLLQKKLRFTLGNQPHFGMNNIMAAGYGLTWNYHKIPVLKIPRSPLVSVEAVTLNTWGGDPQTLVLGTDYDVDTNSEPGRVLFYNLYNTLNFVKDIQVDFTAGFSTTKVPIQLKQAVLVIVQGLYQHRGDTGDEAIPAAAFNLMSPYREELFGGFHG